VSIANGWKYKTFDEFSTKELFKTFNEAHPTKMTVAEFMNFITGEQAVIGDKTQSELDLQNFFNENDLGLIVKNGLVVSEYADAVDRVHEDMLGISTLNKLGLTINGQTHKIVKMGKGRRDMVFNKNQIQELANMGYAIAADGTILNYDSLSADIQKAKINAVNNNNIVDTSTPDTKQNTNLIDRVLNKFRSLSSGADKVPQASKDDSQKY